MSDHPITPPPKLVQQWWEESNYQQYTGSEAEEYVVSMAAQWGADQELEACCEEMKSIPSPLGIPFGEMASNALRAARRPKPLSLKEQALDQLKSVEDRYGLINTDYIRRALEQLDD